MRLRRHAQGRPAGTVARETLDDRAQEFPRVDERLTSLPHRYSCTVTSSATAELGGEGLLKHDRY
ncbi:carotenoid oxygenase family protein [Actinomadura formosensis]|uniref:carotenoid oxygenase family protein n=1 Tax=Actinomadura formosensis TaxID=60706 RepID=UPI0008312815|nr:carotenoid oxygenase family protein [Actinomadura formosensis]